MRRVTAVLFCLTLVAACGDDYEAPPDADTPTEGPESGDTPKAADSEPECTCGDAHTDVMGCAHEDCVSGAGNHANPDCACGTLAADASRRDDAAKSVDVEKQEWPKAAADDNESTVIVMKGGRTLRGHVVSDDGSKIELQIRGSKTVLPYRMLAKKTVYRLAAARLDPKSAKGAIEVGDLAAKAGLYDKARAHYQAAGRLDASLAADVKTRVEAMDQTAAAGLVDAGRAAHAAGDERGARRHLGAVRRHFPASKSAAEADKLLETLPTAAISALPDKQERVMKTPLGLCRDADGKLRAGLRAGSSRSHGSGDFRDAVEACKRVREMLVSMRDENEGKSELIAAMDRLDAWARQTMIECHVHMAEGHLTDKDYERAFYEVNEALGIGTDSAAVALERRIKLAQDGKKGYAWEHMR